MAQFFLCQKCESESKRNKRGECLHCLEDARAAACVEALEGIPTEAIPRFMECVKMAIYDWTVRQETCGLFIGIEEAAKLLKADEK